MKDCINIYDENDKKETVEVVCKFTLPNYSYNYIIYKSLDDGNDYYIARYKGDNIVFTDNELSDEELELSNQILERIK